MHFQNKSSMPTYTRTFTFTPKCICIHIRFAYTLTYSLGDTFGETVLIDEMQLATRVQILDETVCITYRANALVRALIFLFLRK